MFNSLLSTLTSGAHVAMLACAIGGLTKRVPVPWCWRLLLSREFEGWNANKAGLEL